VAGVPDESVGDRSGMNDRVAGGMRAHAGPA
jgi:hypothetical protein